MKSTLKVVGVILLISAILPVLFYVGLILWGDWHDEWASGRESSEYIGNEDCNIAVIPVTGDVTTFTGEFDEFGNEYLTARMSDILVSIENAEIDPEIDGILTIIDSAGGSAAAGEAIAAELKKSEMPVAAYIYDVGASAAYLVATGADTIIASPFSDVGSIGVTMSYLDRSGQNKEQGIEFVPLTSAKFKDYGSPDKPLTAEERKLMERDLAVWHDEFVEQVATNRNLPVGDVAKLADGSTLPGKLALEKKLIDQIGNKEAVRWWFAGKLNMPIDGVVFCQ